MIMKTNVSSYFPMITLLILLLIPSSYLGDAEIIGYPSFVNGPNSWRNTPSSDFSFWGSAGVGPILVYGKFVFGFQCSFEGDDCLIVVSIFKTISDGNSRFSPQVVWAANRNNPVEIQALTASKSISRLTLGSEGNLKLLDKTNLTVWQSFDHPTDVLVLGQKLASGQKLRSSVWPFDSSEGLFAFSIIDGVFNAYIDSDPSQMYYRSFVSEDQSYAEFQTGGFGSLIMAGPANFIQLGSDDHLKAYEFKEQGLKWVGTDMLDTDQCSYPLACGKYGVCSETGCSCPDDASENETAYFKPNNFTADDGCHAISPISCELSLYHSFLELRRINTRYLDYILSSKTLQLEDCKEACLKNCSCRAIMYNGRNKCLLLSQVFSMRRKKVQSSPIFSQRPSRNPSSPNFPRRKRQNTIVIVGSLLGTIFGVFLIFSFLFLRFKNGFQEYEEDYLDNMPGMPNRFSYEELKNVTYNFSNKLGEGGFGSVFRGILPSGSEVAVKHLVGFGPTIGSIHYFNLVTSVGFCAEKSNRLLVYEYMGNGSLDQWIFNKNQEPALGWQIRKKIILDIAKGLAYLHEECNQKILHLDIKSQNILLDENFNAKVSDFGLSKLIGRDQSRVVTTMRGTPGYTAPEWLSSVITEKVDVYSFVIVVLEILCGHRHLVGLFRRKQEMGQLMDLVDKCNDDMLSNAAEVVEMMKVAAWCLQTEYARRPSMSIVVKLFEGSVDVVGNMNEDLLNGLTHEAMETFASTVLPSMLSGPR
ncbi:hypothetical protein ES332_A13G009700v1 [Gossypium tomentosum]|uniref:non-specific serine/threonine protein kinase n=1 Tax=Gossypium tomentosum TaxID=34277 RepID=A0A5D2MF39_GOSTO|nr:hypothetical protein ES332_A13G009700v1 [Gossypium tomentosum]